ncbi:MAG TPA: methylated-DNA--[protein]-cysteine S-methyltransferase [Gammaproteobacteria bacterium]|nr:methylated-DNA--[protein]-cysteine S-methyltransferase [Gammaproteobacteria bacterium]
MKKTVFSIGYIDSPLGKMIALANADALVWLSFESSERAKQSLQHFLKKQGASTETKPSSVLTQLTTELEQYFKHQRTAFTVPLKPMGTAFQQSVWQSLLAIPFGETRSYLDLAKHIQHPKAFRAVALANGANPISLMIPCHRVINHNGKMGGYSGGMEKKIGLLNHESKHPVFAAIKDIF